LFPLRLEELQFTPMEMAWVYTPFALAALVAPLLAGQVADRWVPAERCLACCAFVAASLLWVLADLTRPWAVFSVCLAFWFFMIPVLTLGTTLSFRQLSSPERDFGKVRLWGTVGWIVPGLLLGLWFENSDWLRPLHAFLRPEHPDSETADSLRLAAFLAWTLSLYALTLPHTPPHRSLSIDAQAASWRRFFDAPVAAVRLLRHRSFAILCVCSLGLYVTISFTSQMTPLLLRNLGFEKPQISRLLPISQSMEILTLALLPMLLLRLNVRGTLLLGLVAWAVGLLVLTVGQPDWLVVGSLGLHGVCICCYLIAGQLYVNRRAGADFRASAQGLFTFINGLGMLLGHLLVGGTRSLVSGQLTLGFATAAVLAGALVIVFVVGFQGDTDRVDAAPR
jgi:MFS family permease